MPHSCLIGSLIVRNWLEMKPQRYDENLEL
jgi:hypothetical protein